MQDKLIKPHGSETLNPLYVSDSKKREELIKEAETLPSIVISSAAAANAVMMASGYFNPLKGFMNLADSLSVAEKMQLSNGLFWPVPIVNVAKDASAIKGAKRIALRDPNVEGNPVIAIEDVEAIEEATADQMKLMTEIVFGTLDPKHPGVEAFNSVGNIFISGPIQVLNYSYFITDFPETFRTAVQIRDIIRKNDWKKVAAFQTRNPMHRAHEELVRQHGAGAICTIPLVTNGKFFGGLTFERSADKVFDQATVEFCEVVAEVIGPILDAKRRNEQWLIKKAGEALVVQLRKLLGPAHLALRLSVAALAALVIFFMFARGDYRVTAPTTLEGVVQRVVVASFDGYVVEAPTRAGDVVQKGKVLCLLDDKDLKLERLKWSTQREQLLKQHREAMAKHDRAQFRIVKAKIDQAEAQLSLLDEQLARTKIVAPFNGVVMSGDLSQSLGAPVERGQVLFVVAPLDAYRVIVEVDERDINEIKVGQRGELVLSSMPGEVFPLVVNKITPVSTAREGRNYFRVEALLEVASERLRPGMEGVGKITIDRRKLIWIWTHQLIDWLRLQIWRWMP